MDGLMSMNNPSRNHTPWLFILFARTVFLIIMLLKKGGRVTFAFISVSLSSSWRYGDFSFFFLDVSIHYPSMYTIMHPITAVVICGQAVPLLDRCSHPG